MICINHPDREALPFKIVRDQGYFTEICNECLALRLNPNNKAGVKEDFERKRRRK
jgi:hypothetical protein